MRAALKRFSVKSGAVNRRQSTRTRKILTIAKRKMTTIVIDVGSAAAPIFGREDAPRNK